MGGTIHGAFSDLEQPWDSPSLWFFGVPSAAPFICSFRRRASRFQAWGEPAEVCRVAAGQVYLSVAAAAVRRACGGYFFGGQK